MVEKAELEQLLFGLVLHLGQQIDGVGFPKIQ
ncbi:hypothetical protein A2U01_0086129, partial [Trifolium medium]|nr:hypothetical protein [Trifolium medium]